MGGFMVSGGVHPNVLIMGMSRPRAFLFSASSSSTPTFSCEGKTLVSAKAHPALSEYYQWDDSHSPCRLFEIVKLWWSGHPAVLPR